jgi:hypothetical protein
MMDAMAWTLVLHRLLAWSPGAAAQLPPRDAPDD